MRFKLWITVTTLGWLVLLISIPFVSEFPRSNWVCICWLVYLFGHLAGEALFPGGERAVSQLSRQPFHSRLSLLLAALGAVVLVSLFWLTYALRHDWLSQPMRGFAVRVGLAMLGLSSVACFGHRYFLMARYWPTPPAT